jgi:hypothetical protein
VPEDVATIAEWIEQDPAHRGSDASFYAASERNVSCFTVEWDNAPAMFVREEAHYQEVVLHIQFAPFDRKSVVAALREGYPLVAFDAKERGFMRVKFDTKSPALARVMFDLGFRAQMIADL